MSTFGNLCPVCTSVHVLCVRLRVGARRFRPSSVVLWRDASQSAHWQRCVRWMNARRTRSAASGGSVNTIRRVYPCTSKACMLVHAYPRLFLDSSMKFDCVASVNRCHGDAGTKRFIPRTHLSQCEPGSWSSMAVSVVAVLAASGASIRIIPFLGALIPRSADIFSPQQMQKSARARTHKPLRWWT